MTGLMILTILGGCLIVIVYRDTCRNKVEPPQAVLKPLPEYRVERRNGVMWSVATYETGAEVWTVIRRAA